MSSAYDIAAITLESRTRAGPSRTPTVSPQSSPLTTQDSRVPRRASRQTALRRRPAGHPDELVHAAVGDVVVSADRTKARALVHRDRAMVERRNRQGEVRRAEMRGGVV